MSFASFVVRFFIILRKSWLEEKEADRVLYLAVPIETYQDFFQLSFVQRTLDRYQIKLIIYDPKREEIRLWIK